MTLDALGRVVAHLASQLEVGKHVAHPDQELPQSVSHIELFEQLDLLLEGEIGRIDGEIGEAARVVHGEYALGDPPHAPVFEDGTDDGAVLLDEALELVVQDVDLGVGLRLHPQRSLSIGGSGADAGTSQPGYDDAVVLDVLDGGDGAHRAEPSLDPGDEEHSVVALAGRGGHGGATLVGLDPDRHHHVREDDSIVEREDGERDAGGLWHFRVRSVGRGRAQPPPLPPHSRSHKITLRFSSGHLSRSKGPRPRVSADEPTQA